MGLSLGAILAVSAGPAEAQLVIAPPVIGKKVTAPQDAIERAILDELIAAGVPRIEPTSRLLIALEKCKNSMSCLADTGKGVRATHVLHTIMDERDGQVLAQLSLISVKARDREKSERRKTGTEYQSVERAVRELARAMVQHMKDSPEFPRFGEVAQAVVAPPPLVAPAPSPAPQPQPQPPIAVAPRPAPPPAALPQGSVLAPRDASNAAPMAVRVEKPKRGTNFLAIGVGSVGVAGIAAGVVSLVMAHSDASARDSTPQVFVDERQQLDDSANTKQDLAVVLMSGGGAALLGSIILLATEIGAPLEDVSVTRDGVAIAF